jgi:hypothetical protein
MYLNRSSDAERELLEDLVIFCKDAGLVDGDPLFCSHRLGRRKLLHPRMVNDALKLMATALGFDQILFAFSTHCFRIGGATALRAKGVPKEAVRRIGGWAPGSSAVDIYELETPHQTPNALSAIMPSDYCTTVDAADVWNMLPPAIRRRVFPGNAAGVAL